MNHHYCHRLKNTAPALSLPASSSGLRKVGSGITEPTSIFNSLQYTNAY